MSEHPEHRRRYRIGLIGCGFISAMQLASYRSVDLDVVALCDRNLHKAVARQQEFFPEATVTDEASDLLARHDIDIVDIATHVEGRAQLIEHALRSGKHVLSQKPFVRDLDEGAHLIATASEAGKLLAVNHNGRWAPHFAAALTEVHAGTIGSVSSADFAVYWPHDQDFEHDPHFSTMEDLVVFDFGIHWFDVVAQLMLDAGDARSVYSSARQRPGARVSVATDVEVVIEFERAVATILFRASAAREEYGGYRIEGSAGTILHHGLSLSGERVEVISHDSRKSIELVGDWWTQGMRGPMLELIDAIEHSREPTNSASSAIRALELAFAAKASIAQGRPVAPGTARRSSLSPAAESTATTALHE